MTKETRKSSHIKTSSKKTEKKRPEDDVSIKHIGLVKNADKLISKKLGPKKTNKALLSNYALGEILDIHINKIRSSNIQSSNPRGEITPYEMERILGK